MSISLVPLLGISHVSWIFRWILSFRVNVLLEKTEYLHDIFALCTCNLWVFRCWECMILLAFGEPYLLLCYALRKTRFLIFLHTLYFSFFLSFLKFFGTLKRSWLLLLRCSWVDGISVCYVYFLVYIIYGCLIVENVWHLAFLINLCSWFLCHMINRLVVRWCKSGVGRFYVLLYDFCVVHTGNCWNCVPMSLIEHGFFMEICFHIHVNIVVVIGFDLLNIICMEPFT